LLVIGSRTKSLRRETKINSVVPDNFAGSFTETVNSFASTCFDVHALFLPLSRDALEFPMQVDPVVTGCLSRDE